MREIKFRGQWEKDGKWVYGSLMTYPNCATDIRFYDNGWEKYLTVIPKTVGQYTGLHDKNGKEIYEGDIFGGTLEMCFVLWLHSETRFAISCVGELHEVRFEDMKREDLEVIGNIWENPELLEGENK